MIKRPQIEILFATEGGLRRYWSDDDKLRFVEESFIVNRQATAMARRHCICQSLLTSWRRQYRNSELGASRAVSPICGEA
ncbi:transposase [uncultured Pseudosulfitobacter sp.]|uniref:transposase n=1 Tax=uncultured Pseudosulfitobacter sp. TaxID=2854214 RepID=UPI0030D76828